MQTPVRDDSVMWDIEAAFARARQSTKGGKRVLDKPKGIYYIYFNVGRSKRNEDKRNGKRQIHFLSESLNCTARCKRSRFGSSEGGRLALPERREVATCPRGRGSGERKAK